MATSGNNKESSKLDPSLATRKSIFIHINSPDTQARELAWEEFNEKYGPIIAGWARRCGASHDEAMDIVQNVMLGFFRVSPAFVYSPDRGRFRGYLKTATLTALHKVLSKRMQLADSAAIGQTPAADSQWDQTWEAELLRKAMSCAEMQCKSEHYQVFLQHQIMGLTGDAVAQACGMSVANVHKVCQRVRDVIRGELTRLEVEYG